RSAGRLSAEYVHSLLFRLTNPSPAASQSGSRADPHLVSVETHLGHLPPEIAFAAEGHETVIGSRETRIRRVHLAIDLVRDLVTGVHDLLRKGPQLHTAGKQPAERRRL